MFVIEIEIAGERWWVKSIDNVGVHPTSRLDKAQVYATEIDACVAMTYIHSMHRPLIVKLPKETQ